MITEPGASLSPRARLQSCARSASAVGWYKTWTLDSGLDYGLDYGIDFGQDSELNLRFQAFPLPST